MRVRFSPAADRKLNRIDAYIARSNPYSAAKVLERINSTAASLATFPGRGPLLEGGKRMLALPRPYVLVYEVVGDTVWIVDVFHGAQDRPSP